MPIQQFKAKLSEKQILSNGTYIFCKFELVEPNRIEFLAGQYILLNTPTTPQKRQYSIVSAPRLSHAIELLVELIPDGKASGYLNSLSDGAEISFFAPAGEFTIKDEVQNTQDPLVFVGTGSGLAPLRSMILDQLRTRESTREIWLYWGMRYAENLFWLDQFQELANNFKNFHFHVVLSKAPDDWTLCRGRVTDCLTVHTLPERAQYYLCGNSHMIEDVTKTLTTRGVVVANIHHEKFI